MGNKRYGVALGHSVTLALGVGVLLLFLFGTSKGQKFVNDATQSARLKAFLYMIRYSEGTLGLGGYKTLYGGRAWSGSDATHPALMGWGGLVLSDAHCKGAGMASGCVSTAAGAYQFLRGTWTRLARRLSLPDFGEDSQDRAAIELIRESGALDDVLAGKFSIAVNKVRKVWASLPGAGYGQGERSMLALANVYNKALTSLT